MTDLNRRNFVGMGAAVAAGAMILNCDSKKSVDLNLPPLLEQAPDGPTLKAGLIGCGGRGTGAALDFLSAGPNLEIVALGDVFQDRIDRCNNKLKEEKGVEVAKENQFLGFDAYQKVLDFGVDIVLIATPPHFRPEHFAAAVSAKKDVFMEKPLAVDPVGVRSIMASAKKAEAFGLSVVTGTQRRHQLDYIETLKMIAEGAIGDIVSANCYWNMKQLWYRTRNRKWSDMEFMIRDWVNWCWLSGDHIVEQHIHNLDVINWFTGSQPSKAVGFGARHRRVTGDQYDFFSIDFTYENGIHVHSMSRQINGCANNVSEWIVGTKGVSNCQNVIKKHDGSVVWQYEYPKDEAGNSTDALKIPSKIQEHIDLVTAIRTKTPRVEAEETAVSTMTSIMGRMSAYSGKEVTWEEAMNSNMRLGPKEYKMGRVNMKAVVPVPGDAKV